MTAPECDAVDCEATRRLEAVVFEAIDVERTYCPKHSRGVHDELCSGGPRQVTSP